MIINDTINLHNVGQTKSYKGGLMLLRYPSNVISKMGYGPNIKGKTKALYPAMVEIQVSTLSSYVEISLMAIESDAQVICYINNFSVGIANIRKGKSKEFVLNFINAKWNIFIVLVINLFCGVLLCLLMQEYPFMKL